MDFIVKLLKSKDLITGVVYNIVLVIIEQLTKYMILIAYIESSIAKELVFTFLREVVLRHRLLKEILLDRDKLFTLKF